MLGESGGDSAGIRHPGVDLLGREVPERVCDTDSEVGSRGAIGGARSHRVQVASLHDAVTNLGVGGSAKGGLTSSVDRRRWWGRCCRALGGVLSKYAGAAGAGVGGMKGGGVGEASAEAGRVGSPVAAATPLPFGD